MRKSNKVAAAVLGLLLICLLIDHRGEAIRSARAANSFLLDLLQQVGMQATPTQSGAMAPLDKAAAPIPVRVAISCVMPTYVETGPAGSEVWTATSNGALSTSCTDGVVLGPGTYRVLIPYNDWSLPDAGIGILTQGTAGTPWSIARSTQNGENTAARLAGSVVFVSDGFERGLWYSRNPTIGAVGTDALLWRQAGPPSVRHGWEARLSFSENVALLTSPTITSGQTSIGGFSTFSTSSGSGITTTATGEGTFSQGTAVTGNIQVYTQSFDPTLLRTEAEFGVRFSVGSLSDVNGTYTIIFGLYLDNNNRSGIILNPSAAGVGMDHTTMVGGVAGATRTLCASCFAIGTQYRYVLRKLFGQSVWQIYFDSGTGVLAYVADTPALPTNQALRIYSPKTAGGQNRPFTVYETWATVYDPFVLGV